MRSSSLVLLMLVAACSDSPSDPLPLIDASTDDVPVADMANDADMGVDLAAACVDGADWMPGTAIFVERPDVGFEAMGVEAQHMNSVDWSGDGWPDLALRRDNTRELTWDDWDTGARSFWLLENQRDGTFVDRTRESGIVQSRFIVDYGRPAELTVFGDVDNDGDLDAYTGYRSTGASNEGAEIMLNDGAGNFVASEPGPLFRKAGLPWPTYGASFLDHNRDGKLDLWVVYFANNGVALSDILWEQEDAGAFADRSSLYGITYDRTQIAYDEGRGPTAGWGATVCDLNGDGWPELMATSYSRLPNTMWLGGESYTNISVSSGYAFDDDQDWSDDESARCWCTLHPADEGCAGVPPPDVFGCEEDDDAWRWSHDTGRELWQLGGNSATTLCVDVDADGDLDLLAGELRHWDVGSSSDRTELMINDGGASPVFSRPGREATGLGRIPESDRWDEGDLDAAALDFDNDGHPDLWLNSSDYGGTRAHLYHHVGPALYEEVDVADFTELRRAKGITVADFDRDGDLDVVASRSPMRCTDTSDPECVGFHARYFENVVGNQNNWVQLSLEGIEGTNRAAIGARVTVDNGEHIQVQEVGGGYGRMGLQHDLTLHFGLGRACEATVTVRWPNTDLTEQTFTIAAGHRWRVVQGSSPTLAP